MIQSHQLAFVWACPFLFPDPANGRSFADEVEPVFHTQKCLSGLVIVMGGI
jgi:hypothetical protein